MHCKAILLTILIGGCVPTFAQESSGTMVKAAPDTMLAERTALRGADLPLVDCAWYGRDVALDGILEKATAILSDNGKVSYYLLRPEAALCVNGDPLSTSERALQIVNAVQIAARPGDFDFLSNLINGPITIRGVLFGATTAHHFQSLLIDMQTVEPQSPATIAFRDFWSNFRTAAIRHDCSAMADMAATPFQHMGSLDSDPVHLLDRATLAEQCLAWLQSDALMSEGSASDAFANAAILPPTTWRTEPQGDDHARFDAFEFEYEQAEWRWTGYYRQN